MSKTLLDLALEYAAKGYRVSPLKERSKVPASEHGVKDATSDPAEVRKLWGPNPNYNVGIACGGEEGLLFIDVDPRSGGNETLTRLIANCGQLIHGTIVVRTGSGGHHYGVRHRGETLRKDADRPGIDLQGEGRYVVAAGSIHENGNVYTLESHGGELPPIASLVELPAPYLAAFQTHSSKSSVIKRVSPELIAAVRAEVAQMPFFNRGAKRQRTDSKGFPPYHPQIVVRAGRV